MNTKLLIVDDEKSIADILCETFEDEGIPSKSLYNGNDAFNYIKDHPEIELVLSDIQMPHGNGIDLLNKVQQLESAPKVVFMTGYSEYSKSDLLEKGAIQVFSKPVNLDELITEVCNYLSE